MTLNLQFDHISIPVEVPQETEFQVPQSECWVTNPRTHPQRIEYLRFKAKPDLVVGSLTTSISGGLFLHGHQFPVPL